MASCTRILIVEDSPTDRELLRYLLETRFQEEAKFREATTLEEALIYLARGTTDCVILDLQLPDSTGRETFRTIASKYPDIPIIVMTHNKDRQLAIDMIAEGAADYVLKSYTDEDELFRRVIFAIEKHGRTIRMDPAHINSMRRVEKAKVNMLHAHQSGQHSAIRDMTVETTSAVADLSQKLFSEMQKMSNQLTTNQTQIDHVVKTVETLDRELLRGHSVRPSMRSQMDLMTHRVEEMEADLKGVKDGAKKAEDARRQEEVQFKQAKMSDRTKVILALVALIGTLATAIVTFYVGKAKEEAKERDAKSLVAP